MARTSSIEKSLPVRGLFLRDIVAGLRLWRQRARSRRDLLWLDERLLRDIGIDQKSAEEEACKPFWRG